MPPHTALSANSVCFQQSKRRFSGWIPFCSQAANAGIEAMRPYAMKKDCKCRSIPASNPGNSNWLAHSACVPVGPHPVGFSVRPYADGGRCSDSAPPLRQPSQPRGLGAASGYSSRRPTQKAVGKLRRCGAASQASHSSGYCCRIARHSQLIAARATMQEKCCIVQS